jgi:hypothetical protein
MSEENNNQSSQDDGSQTPASPQASQQPQAAQQQAQPAQGKPERPVFPSNTLLTEAAQRMEVLPDTKSETSKDE